LIFISFHPKQGKQLSLFGHPNQADGWPLKKGLDRRRERNQYEMYVSFLSHLFSDFHSPLPQKVGMGERKLRSDVLREPITFHSPLPKE